MSEDHSPDGFGEVISELRHANYRGAKLLRDRVEGIHEECEKNLNEAAPLRALLEEWKGGQKATYTLDRHIELCFCSIAGELGSVSALPDVLKDAILGVYWELMDLALDTTYNGLPRIIREKGDIASGFEEFVNATASILAKHSALRQMINSYRDIDPIQQPRAHSVSLSLISDSLYYDIDAGLPLIVRPLIRRMKPCTLRYHGLTEAQRKLLIARLR